MIESPAGEGSSRREGQTITFLAPAQNNNTRPLPREQENEGHVGAQEKCFWWLHVDRKM